MILANRRSGANHGEYQKQQSSDFQPEHVDHSRDTLQGDTTRLIKGFDPAVLAGSASCYSQEGAPEFAG